MPAIRAIPVVLITLTVGPVLTSLGAQAAPPLPKDSLTLGRTWTRWVREQQADSLFTAVVPGGAGAMSSSANLGELLRGLAERAGTPLAVVEERFIWRGGSRQFWSTYAASQAEEPIVIRLVMTTDGRVGGIGLSPLSRVPPIDSGGPVIKP